MKRLGAPSSEDGALSTTCIIVQDQRVFPRQKTAVYVDMRSAHEEEALRAVSSSTHRTISLSHASGLLESASLKVLYGGACTTFLPTATVEGHTVSGKNCKGAGEQ